MRLREKKYTRPDRPHCPQMATIVVDGNGIRCEDRCENSKGVQVLPAAISDHREWMLVNGLPS